MLCSLCSGVELVPTVLVLSIRSCPGRLASISPYVTHIHIERAPLIRAISPFLIFPFSALSSFKFFLAGLWHWRSCAECSTVCVTYLLIINMYYGIYNQPYFRFIEDNSLQCGPSVSRWRKCEFELSTFHHLKLSHRLERRECCRHCGFFTQNLLFELTFPSEPASQFLDVVR